MLLISPFLSTSNFIALRIPLSNRKSYPRLVERERERERERECERESMRDGSRSDRSNNETKEREF
jgi:hypothetical protein